MSSKSGFVIFLILLVGLSGCEGKEETLCLNKQVEIAKHKGDPDVGLDERQMSRVKVRHEEAAECENKG